MTSNNDVRNFKMQWGGTYSHVISKQNQLELPPDNKDLGRVNNDRLTELLLSESKLSYKPAALLCSRSRFRSFSSSALYRVLLRFNMAEKISVYQ
jgi:hypothetical protein